MPLYRRLYDSKQTCSGFLLLLFRRFAGNRSRERKIEMASVRPYTRKLFYKINEVAEIVGVEAYVLRYWETKFPMLKPERYGNDERRYRTKDIDLLLRIRTLLYDEKFTIAGAVERIKKDPSGALDGEFQDRTAAEAAEIVEIPTPEDAQLSLFGAESSEAIESLRRQLREIRSELQAICNG